VEPLPPGVAGWNWGAFLLNWIWGLGNNTFVALLALIPFVNVIMVFVLGAKGNEWAWRNKRWESIEHFKRVQRNWAVAGVIVWLAVLGLFAAIFFSVVAAIKNSDVYNLALAKINANEEAVRLLGPPIEAGFPMGSFRLDGPSGEAALSIPVTGSKSRGTIYLEATREMGAWKFGRIELEIEGQEKRIDLNTGRAVLPRSKSETEASQRALCTRFLDARRSCTMMLASSHTPPAAAPRKHSIARPG
jgi:hypothetical protein